MEIIKEVAMFWLYIIVGCFGGLMLFLIVLHIVTKVRSNSMKSDFDIAY